MQGLTPYVVGFAAALGALIDGTHGALLGTTIVLGIILVVSLLGASKLAAQQRELEEQFANALADEAKHSVPAEQAEWGGLPDIRDIPPQADHPSA